MARILWIGDAGTATGFGTVSEQIGGRLATHYGHDVHALAVLWEGKYPYEGPLKLYRANAGPSRHALGFDRVVEVLNAVKPELVLTNEDPIQFWQRLFDNRWDPDKLLARHQNLFYGPIDGSDIPLRWMDVEKASTFVPYSKFGADEWEADPDDIVYHGVDREVFHPATPESPITTSAGTLITSKAEAKAEFGIEPDQFVIGRVDTNTERKDYGSTWRAINEAFELGLPHDQVTALFHTRTTGFTNHGVDLGALVTKSKYGKFMITDARGWPVGDVVALLNAMDVFLSTSRGEGFGLTLLEAMAVGVPVIATNFSSIPEVVGKGGILTSPAARVFSPFGQEQRLADTTQMANELVGLFRNRDRLEVLSRLALNQASLGMFDWDVQAHKMNAHVEALLAA